MDNEVQLRLALSEARNVGYVGGRLSQKQLEPLVEAVLPLLDIIQQTALVEQVPKYHADFADRVKIEMGRLYSKRRTMAGKKRKVLAAPQVGPVAAEALRIFELVFRINGRHDRRGKNA